MTNRRSMLAGSANFVCGLLPLVAGAVFTRPVAAGTPLSMPHGAGPTIYVSIVMHNEEPPGYPHFWENEAAFDLYRDKLLDFATMLHDEGVAFNFQPEWSFLQGTLNYDDGPATAGKPLSVYLRQDLGFEVDPHAHETQYNYADVAYLLEQVFTPYEPVPEVPKVAGGLIAWPPDESILDRLSAPMACSEYAGTGDPWKPEILWGAATANHENESYTWVSGVWRPRDAARFFEDDPCGDLVCVGPFSKTWDGLDLLLAKRLAGQLDPSRIYTATIFLQHADLLEPGYLDGFRTRIESYGADEAAGVIQWVGLQELVNIWRTEFDSEPNVHPYSGVPVASGHYTPCSIQDADPLPGERLLVTDSGDASEGQPSGVYEIDRNGEILWKMTDGLNAPESAERMSDGSTVIADTGNDRVLIVAADGSTIWTTGTLALSDGSTLSDPCDVQPVLPAGNVLIADRGNQRVIEITPGGAVAWQFGVTGVPGSDAVHLWEPCSARRAPGGLTVVSDTGNDRVLEILGGVVQWAGTGFLAPQDARRLGSGCTLVTDAGNRRVVERDMPGACDWTCDHELISPRCAARLPNGNTMIADNDRILEVDADADVVWCFTGPSNYTEVVIPNPTSGVGLHAHVHRPMIFDPFATYPGLVLVPGGSLTGASWDLQGHAQALANSGAVVIHFDPDGRGTSTDGGTYTVEDYDGYLQQDGLREVLAYLVGLPETNDERSGIFSMSYGITMATGMLARYPGAPPCAFLLDWEGPHDRSLTSYIFGGHVPHEPNEDAFWSEREALTFMPSVEPPYLRIQSDVDHNGAVHDNRHAIALLNAATHVFYGGDGQSAWTRLNDDSNLPNRTYDVLAPPPWLAEDRDGIGYWISRFLDFLDSSTLDVPVTGNSSTARRLVLLGPSPFRTTVAFELTLDRPEAVELSIYDVGGRRVRRMTGALLGPGQHRVTWDGTDEGGRQLPSGLYFVRSGRPEDLGLKLVLVR